jgi:hypothetical protein
MYYTLATIVLLLLVAHVLYEDWRDAVENRRRENEED